MNVAGMSSASDQQKQQITALQCCHVCIYFHVGRNHNQQVTTKGAALKWYYDQKITFTFSLNFETMFMKHSPSEILSLDFEKTVYLNCNFLI